MTDERWNPETALRQAVTFFQALPHLEQATCGGEILHIYFDPYTSELVAETGDGTGMGRAYIDVKP